METNTEGIKLLSSNHPLCLPEGHTARDTRSPAASKGAGNLDFLMKLKHCSFQPLREETTLILHHVFQKTPQRKTKQTDSRQRGKQKLNREGKWLAYKNIKRKGRY